MLIRRHHLPDGMAHFLARRLGDAQPPAQYVRRDAFAGVDDVIHPLEPLRLLLCMGVLVVTLDYF